jgi:hypothetical protein
MAYSKDDIFFICDTILIVVAQQHLWSSYFTSQMFSDCNCCDYPIPLYGNNVTSPIMCQFNIPQPWSPQQ